MVCACDIENCLNFLYDKYTPAKEKEMFLSKKEV